MKKTFHRYFKKIMKIKIIKALLGVFTVLMSYKLVRNLLYFNKFFIWLIGLVFVGFNLNDYHLFKELLLIINDKKNYILHPY